MSDSRSLIVAGHEKPAARARLLSLDVYRGLIMFLLVGEGAAFYHALGEWNEAKGLGLGGVVDQFHHVAWRGLVFWDVVQPAFMFIVGVAMAFSLRRRAERGDGWWKQFGHIGWRCGVLFLLGTGLHCWYADALVFELWNVLTQLSFTILVAFLIFRWPWQAQLGVAIGLVVATDLAYRLVHVGEFTGTFEPGRNFGSWVDTVLMGKVNSGHWVAVNAVPTAAHTIAGVLAGKLLLAERSAGLKVGVLALVGGALIGLGYAMDWAGVAPIVKRICTSSFVLASGGWCVLALALFFVVFDSGRDVGERWRGWRLWLGWVFVVVGMNPILIYMVTETLAWGTLNPKVGVFVAGALEPWGVHANGVALATAGVTWLLLWGLCVWLYRRRIFVRI